MRKLLKSTFAIATAAILATTSCAQKEPLDVMTFNESITAAEIVERINSMGEASMENESLIEEIFIDYTKLSEAEKEKVTNYEALDDARNAITKLYHTEEKDGPRIDRSKIQIGTYCFYNTSEERFQWLKEANIDFIIGAPYNTDVLDLCLKYEVGAFLSYLPGWYGGDGSNAGGYVNAVPSGTFNSYAENFVDHPAIWAVDVGDEPSALDFPHYGVMIDEAKALFPNQFVYLNIYPLYADDIQEGAANYTEYIQAYVDNINTDYISFDFYNIAEKAQTPKNTGHETGSDFFMLRHIENLRIVSKACKEKDIDMWTVIQANALSDKPLDYLTLEQIKSQVYPSLAFGTQEISWACWENGWYDFDTNMISSAGVRTPSYYGVKEVNSYIKALSPVYMRYENTDTAFVGNIGAVRQRETMFGEDELNFIKTDGNVFEQDMFQDIKVVCDDAVILAGSFVKRSGMGDAILFSNLTNFFGTDDIYKTEDFTSTEISFKLKDTDRKVVIYYPKTAYVMEPDENGVYRFSLENSDGAFITAE